jgi:hypothetical protein
MSDMNSERADRLSSAGAIAELDPNSLVGSFFHSDRKRHWQGCVVAEPANGVFLVELFNWVGPQFESTYQRLVRLEEMMEWRFYDTADWMDHAFEQVVKKLWDERE